MKATVKSDMYSFSDEVMIEQWAFIDTVLMMFTVSNDVSG